MQLDELILKFKSEFGKVINDANSLISKFSKLDNTTSKVSSDFDKISKSASGMGNGFKASERNIQSLENRLKFMKNEFKEHVSLYKQWGDLATTKTPDSIKGLSGEEVSKAFGDPITRDSLLQERQEIDALQSKISELKAQVGSVPKLKVVPNTKEGEQNIKNVGDEANKTGRKFDNLNNKTKKVNNTFSTVSKSFKNLKSSFGSFGDKISNSMDKGLKSVKKLALGLIGVRTIMSLLTKSVNAYLSFDSDLQDSLNNSWNMLGSLLAPAIELVAKLFAIATNYIYQFVQALTGIDLVARANAKALQNQAKATKKASEAQRGLLGMDEITNLPTEPGAGGDIPQIKVDGIDAKGIFAELIEAFKRHKWHRAGEIIAEGINKGLNKIKWDKVREQAENTGRNIADFLNGVFELDWKLLGKSIANSINTTIDFVYGFIEKFEWGRLGTGIGDGITSFFENFDINKLTDGINKLADGIYNLLTSALVHFDAELVGNKIIDFLEKIKWSEIATSIVKLFMLWTEKALVLNFTIFGRIVDNLKSYLKNKVEKLGSSLGSFLAEGFSNGFKGIFNLLITSINNALIPVRGLIVALGTIGGKNISLNNIKIPYLETGTPNIETEGLYHLHEGEMVVPRKYNPNTDGYDNGRDNKQIIDLLISLNSTMLEYADRPININMSGKKVAQGIYDDLQQISRNKNMSTVVTRS